jgi:uncharacterized protein involved in exopolysaccharide biosynthesis/Mrp family chromosome partitioning ATPase
MNLSRHGRGFGTDFLPDSAANRSEEALGELLLAARRQFWVMVVGAVIGIAGAVFHYATSPKTFEASATLLIEEQRAELEQEISTALPTARNDTSMLNEMQILASLQVASDVVTTLGLTDNPAFTNPPSSLLSETVSGAKASVRALIPEQATEPGDAAPQDADAAAERALMQAAHRLRANTVFHRVGRSFVVEIWYASSDPVLAADVVNAYADAYIADGIRATVQSADERGTWMEARLQDLRAEAQAAADAAEQFRRDVGVADQQGLRELEQQAEALNDLVLRVQNRYRELALESSFPVSAGRILSRALPPRDPTAPRATHVLAAGVFLGLLLGLAVAVLREARETGFRTAGDVTRTLSLPFLGYVPPERGGGLGLRAIISAMTRRAVGAGTGARGSRTGRRASGRAKTLPPRHLAEPGAGIAAEPGPRPHGTAPRVAHPAFEQAVRGVFAGLDRRQGEGGGRLLAVAALGAGEDRSAIALELAQQSCHAGRRCLLVDADLSGGGLSHRLGLGAAPGTLDVLDGTTGLGAAVHVHGAVELDVLPIGQSAEAAPAIAYLSEFGELISDLADGYDDVIIDLPPLLETPEARTLLRQADGVVFVVAWGSTPRQLVHAYLDQDPGLHARGAGVVLSRVNLRRLGRYGVTRPWRTRRQSGSLGAKTT